MLVPWSLVLPTIQSGTIYRDASFIFDDDPTHPTPKHILILSNGPVTNDSFVYCLTTSQYQTYYGSYANYVDIPDSDSPSGHCIVECSRIELVSAKSLEKKYNDGDIQFTKRLSPSEIKEVMDHIESDDTIQNYFKEFLGLL